MLTFFELNHSMRSLVLFLFFLLNLLQFAYVILLFQYRETKTGMKNILFVALVYFSLVFLAEDDRGTNNGLRNLPVLVMAAVWFLMLFYTIYGIYRQVDRRRRILKIQSVKEALDKLPDGLVWFADNGVPVLCNTKMQELFYRMNGRDLQMAQEMEQFIGQFDKTNREHDGKTEWTVVFSDETVWKFERSEITLDLEKRYIQYLAVNITDLYRIRQKIDRDNKKMQEMIQQVQKITENIADITRQEEILTAKMRIHNKMGNCMLVIRKYLTSANPPVREEKEELIELWKENLSELKSEVGAVDSPDAYEMVVRIARSIGLEVVLHGTLPEDSETSYLIVTALRECVTNALGHAKADRLDLLITDSGNQITASFTNDGMVPKGPMKEGGGLSSLRTKIENAGGRMEVISQPIFELKIIFPKTGWKPEGSAKAI